MNAIMAVQMNGVRRNIPKKRFEPIAKPSMGWEAWVTARVLG